MRNQQKIRFGLIGAGGGISTERGNALLENANAVITMVSEFDKSKWENIKERYKAEISQDYHDVVSSNEVDAVVVSTPNVFHYEIIKEAINNNKHVVSEYPMVQSIKHCDELVKLSKVKKTVLHDGLTPRIEAQHKVIMDNLSRIGRPMSANHRYYAGGVAGWYWNSKLAGDFFCSAHIHFIDFQMAYFGEVESVYAKEYALPKEDKKIKIGFVILNFKSGVYGMIEFGVGFSSPSPYTLLVTGKEGYLEFIADERGSKVYGKTDKEGYFKKKLPEINTIKEDTNLFVDEILGKRKPAVDIKLGREVLRITLLASESAKTGKIIKA